MGNDLQKRMGAHVAMMAEHHKRRQGGKLLIEARAEIDRLREWIKIEGEQTDTCTFDALGEICDGCNCWRKKNQKP